MSYEPEPVFKKIIIKMFMHQGMLKSFFLKPGYNFMHPSRRGRKTEGAGIADNTCIEGGRSADTLQKTVQAYKKALQENESQLQ